MNSSHGQVERIQHTVLEAQVEMRQSGDWVTVGSAKEEGTSKSRTQIKIDLWGYCVYYLLPAHQANLKLQENDQAGETSDTNQIFRVKKKLKVSLL